jgi:CheY-like chemotaxis protein
MEAPAGLLVLVVDDEQIIADTLVLILNQNGFDARAVYSGETAIVVAQALRPDILISDIFMNGMTGIDLAKLLCRKLPKCKIFLLSGSRQDAVDDLLRDIGKDAEQFRILRKPIHPEALLAHLGSVA